MKTREGKRRVFQLQIVTVSYVAIQRWRTAAKSAPKPFLRNGISSIEPETGPEMVRIVDGGAFALV